MPQCQAVGRQLAAHHWPGRRVQDRTDQRGRQRAHQQAEHHQQLDRDPHPVHGLMRLTRQIGGLGPQKHVDREAQRIGDAEHGRHRGHHRQHQTHRMRGVQVDGGGKEHFLGQEAVEQRHPGHGRTGHEGQRPGDRHVADQPREPADVARAAFVVDNAGRHEERGLEGGVVDDVKDGRHRRRGTVHAQQQRDQPQVADGRIGQQPLQVGLKHGQERPEEQRGSARPAHQQEPVLSAREHHPQPGQQEDAQLHHGGRVQIGRDRRGRGHGARQPEEERELGALGERPQRDQHQDGAIERVLADDVAAGQDAFQLVAAHHVADHQHAGEQAQAARPRDQQRHPRTAPGIVTMVPVADQQEGIDAGEFPEQHQLHQVARKHHARHRPHERHEEGEEARHRISRRHVVARIEHHQRADAQHQHGEEPRQPVHAQHQIQPQRGQPGDALLDDLAPGNGRKVERRLHQRCQRYHPGRRGFRVAGVGRQHDSDKAAKPRQDDQQDERHGGYPGRAERMWPVNYAGIPIDPSANVS